MDKRVALLIKAWRAIEKTHGGPVREAKAAAAKIPEERMATVEETEKVLSSLGKVSPERAELMSTARYVAGQGRQTSPELGLRGYLFGSTVVPEKTPLGLGRHISRDLDIYLSGKQKPSWLSGQTPEKEEDLRRLTNIFAAPKADVVYEVVPKGRTLGESGVKSVIKGREKYPGIGYNMIRFLSLAPGVVAPLTLSDYLKQGEKE